MTVGTPAVGTVVEITAAQNHIDLPYPATNSGDLLLAAVISRDPTGVPPTLPAGYTAIAQTAVNGGTLIPGILLCYKAATGSESGNLTVSTPTTKLMGQILSIPGVDLTTPLNVAVSLRDTNVPAGTTAIPGITTGSDGCMLVVFAGNNGTTQTSTAPGGFTETMDLSAGSCPGHMSYKLQANAGATGTETITWSGSAKTVGVLVALNPRVSPTNSAATGTANDATVGSTSSPQPAEAAGTGAANDATAGSNKPNPAEAAATGVAMNAAAATLGVIITTTGAGTMVVPGVPVRVRAVWNGVTYAMWRGNVDAWQIGYDPDQPNYTTAAVNATDGTKFIAMYDRVAIAPSLGEGEDTGARIARVLDSANWATYDRLLDDGDSTLQATDLSGNAWTEALNAAQDEAGDLYLDTSNRVVFRHRQSVLRDFDRTTPQAVFGDNPGLGELPLAGMSLTYDGDMLYNIVGATINPVTTPVTTVQQSVRLSGAAGSTTVTASTSLNGIPVGATVHIFGGTTIQSFINSTTFVVADPNLRAFGPASYLVSFLSTADGGGTRQEASDSASINKYGARPTPEQTGMLLQSDEAAANWAGWVLTLTKNPELRIAQITVKPRRDGTVQTFAALLALSYGQRIQVNLTSPDPSGVGDGQRISRDCFIRGIQHTVTPQGDWTTTYTLQSATAYEFYTIGSSTLGKVGDKPLAF